MASRHDDQTPSTEAIRQLGIAIEAVARRTGARISANDARALGAMLYAMPTSQLEALATRGDGVLGSVESIIESLAKLDLAQQKHKDGPAAAQGTPDEAGLAHGFYAGRKLPGGLLDQLAGRASNERGSGSAAYQRELPGATIPGNADMRGFNMAEYYTSPKTFALRSMGMNDNTFDYLRKEFSRTHIESAARDATKLGFDVNDQRMVKNHAIIRQQAVQPDKINKHFQDFQKGLRESKEFRDAALAWDKAKPEDKEAAWKKIEQLSDQQAKKVGLPEDMARQREEAVRKAIGEIKEGTVKNEVQRAIDAATEQKPDSTTGLKTGGAIVKTDEALMESLRQNGAPAATTPVQPAPTAQAQPAPAPKGSASSPPAGQQSTQPQTKPAGVAPR